MIECIDGQAKAKMQTKRQNKDQRMCQKDNNSNKEQTTSQDQ